MFAGKNSSRGAKIASIVVFVGATKPLPPYGGQSLGDTVKTLETVKKANLASAKNQSKPIQITPKIQAWWATCEKIATTADIIPTDLRIASRTNGATRRAWCVANPKMVVMVEVADIANKVGDRPENTVRAKLQVLATVKGNTTTKKLGYIRVLDKSVADSNPTHKDITKVFIYRLAK